MDILTQPIPYGEVIGTALRYVLVFACLALFDAHRLRHRNFWAGLSLAFALLAGFTALNHEGIFTYASAAWVILAALLIGHTAWLAKQRYNRDRGIP